MANYIEEFDIADQSLQWDDEVACNENSSSHFFNDALLDDNEFACSSLEYPQIDTSSLDHDDFSDLRSSGLVEVVGDDDCGRRIIILSACKLPSKTVLSHDRLLRYLYATLETYVEQDYCIVYFHALLNPEDRPSFKWLLNAYKSIDRKFKKNVKALYLVHPTTFLKWAWRMMTPVISYKFGNKMKYVNYLHELNAYVDIRRLIIPQQIIGYNNQLILKNPKMAKIADQFLIPNNPDSLVCQEYVEEETSTNKYQQFNVSLTHILTNHPDVKDNIPPIVRQCIEFLTVNGLETEGLFRKSSSINVIEELIKKSNNGVPIDFEDNPHTAASLLKSFLAKIQDPIIPFTFTNEISKFSDYSKTERVINVETIFRNMPPDNVHILKYITRFLYELSRFDKINKMTSSNLAVVIGPSFVRPQSILCMKNIPSVIIFIETVIEYNDEIFQSVPI